MIREMNLHNNNFTRRTCFLSIYALRVMNYHKNSQNRSAKSSYGNSLFPSKKLTKFQQSSLIRQRSVVDDTADVVDRDFAVFLNI